MHRVSDALCLITNAMIQAANEMDANWLIRSGLSANKALSPIGIGEVDIVPFVAARKL